MSWLFSDNPGGISDSDINNSKSYENYRTLFFAGFVVAPAQESTNATEKGDKNSTKNKKGSTDPYDINTIRKRLLEIKRRNKAKEGMSDTDDDDNKNDISHDFKKLKKISSNAQKEEKTNSSSSSSTFLTELVEDLFTPYGDIDYFYFDDQTGAGVVQFKNGKSGENCFLMSHLLPFTMSSSSEKRTDSSTGDGENNSSSSSSFSLVCLEYANVLPFSPSSRSLFTNSPLSWVSSRKNLYRLQSSSSSSSSSSSIDNWKNHLEFMKNQRARKKLYFKNLSWLRQELLVAVDNDSDEDEGKQNKFKLSAEAASEAQEIIEEHLSTLLFASSSSSSNQKPQQQQQEANLFSQLQSSDFWNLMLLPSCLDKIVSQLCEIDIDEVGISMSSSVSPARSPSKRKQQHQKENSNEQQQDDDDDDDDQELISNLEKRTKLMISMIHSSISILDVWLAIYHTFYSGERARTIHSSVVAVLESKLMTSNNNSDPTCKREDRGAQHQPVAYSLRHPAWPSYAIMTSQLLRNKNNNGQQIHDTSISLAIQRRTDFIKLYSGQVEPLHLGLKEWPGGANDDVGSSYRAVLAMLVSIRPFYLDQSFRHMWVELFATPSQTVIDEKIMTTVPPILECLKEADAKIKKQFHAVSAKQEALLEGAWSILYRASWRMETAFSLIVSYLKLVVPVDRSNDKNQQQQQRQARTKSKSDCDDDFLQQLLEIDTQPALWPLLRPIDSLEIDWKRGRGVLCDEPIVYRRLFDGDEEFSKLTTMNNTQGQQPQQDDMFWDTVVVPILSWILEYGFGQNSAVLHSKYYQRKFLKSLMSFVPPVIAMAVVSVIVFFLLKWGYVAQVQEVVWRGLEEMNMAW